MSDYSDLERRAQAAIDAIGTLSRARQERKFNNVCTPQVVKALIADLQRNERMLLAACMDMGAIGNALGADMNSDGEELLSMVVELKAEVAGLKTGYEAYERVNAELKAECEALRKDAERFSYIERDADSGMSKIYGDDWVSVIDAAMGKGERP